MITEYQGMIQLARFGVCVGELFGSSSLEAFFAVLFVLFVLDVECLVVSCFFCGYLCLRLTAYSLFSVSSSASSSASWSMPEEAL